MSDPRCLSARRCVSRTSTGPAVTAKSETLCHGCVRDIQKCLDELPTYLDLLGQFKGGIGGAVGQSRVGGTSEPKTPLRVSVYDLINEVYKVLAQAGGYAARDLVTLPGGVPTALEARRVHSKAEAVVGLARVWERRRAPCPECGLPTLGQWSGEETIYCTNSDCAHSLTKSEYEQHCELKSKEK